LDPHARAALAGRSVPLRKAAGDAVTMDGAAVRREHADLVARLGPWTAHNVRLADGFYAIGPEPSGDEVKLRRVVQVVSDLLDGRVAGARVLDLACLEIGR